MPFYLAEIIGDGTDAEGNEFRPAILDHLDTDDGWHCLVDGRADSTTMAGHMVVWSPGKADYVKDSRIVRVTDADLASYGVPALQGRQDEREIAEYIGKRFLLRQYLGGDDFLETGRFDDLDGRKQDAIRVKLAHLDLSEVKGATSVDSVLRTLLPQLVVAMDAKPQSPSGTFTDAFTDDGSGTEDLAAHTPTGGTAWTRVDGSADMAQVTGGILRNNTADGSGAAYRCDDQGSSAQYVQYIAISSLEMNAFVCNRLTDRSNFLGVRKNSIGVFYKRVAGAFTQIGTSSAPATNSVVRLESDASNAHTVYDDGVAIIGPTTDSFNSTETRQGVLARTSGAADWADDFEAGVLSAGSIGNPWNYYAQQ